MKRRAARLPILASALVLSISACAGNEGIRPDAERAAVHRAPERPPPYGGADTGPEQLLGLGPDQLDDLLGAPDFKRIDGPAEIRQYRDAGCVLDVFLYADPTSAGYRVTHVDARDRSPAIDDRQTCVTTLLRARRGRTAS